MSKVDYNRDSFNKCLCGGCPVQSESGCTIKKENVLASKKEKLEKEAVMPEAETMPGIYCAGAVGKSDCTDLNDKKSCLCPACPLEITEDLKNNYYCTKGSADEIG